jgi:hypothetical protein
MSIKAIHSQNGMIALKVDDTDDRIMIDVGAGSSRTAPKDVKRVSQTPPKEKDGKQEKVIEIHLGPLPPPPLPLGVIVSDGIGRQSGSGELAFQLQLDAVFTNGAFSPQFVQAFKQSAAATPESDSLNVDAYLPPNHQIDLGLLSRHVTRLGQQVGRKIVMRVGTGLVDS